MNGEQANDAQGIKLLRAGIEQAIEIANNANDPYETAEVSRFLNALLEDPAAALEGNPRPRPNHSLSYVHVMGMLREYIGHLSTALSKEDAREDAQGSSAKALLAEAHYHLGMAQAIRTTWLDLYFSWVMEPAYREVRREALLLASAKGSLKDLRVRARRNGYAR